MKKWELARYLIDAKKRVDSIIYIEQNSHALRNVDIYEKIKTNLREFYINCCIILDKTFSKKKKVLCAKDEIVDRLYHERDKNYAHKDTNYEPLKYATLTEMVSELKKQLSHLAILCSEYLPVVITLDYVPHDRELFRLVEGLTSDGEDNVNIKKYPLRERQGVEQAESTYRVFHDTEEIRNISDLEKSDYATVVEGGINDYEGLQNRQDFCIKSNVLYDYDIWCFFNPETQMPMDRLKKLGIFDKYNVPRMEMLEDPEIRSEIAKILMIEDAE